MLFDSQGKVLGPVVDSVLREGETLKLTKLSAVSTSRDLDAGYLEFDQMEALLAETINSGERVYLENKAQWLAFGRGQASLSLEMRRRKRQ